MASHPMSCYITSYHHMMQSKFLDAYAMRPQFFNKELSSDLAQPLVFSLDIPFLTKYKGYKLDVIFHEDIFPFHCLHHATTTSDLFLNLVLPKPLPDTTPIQHDNTFLLIMMLLPFNINQTPQEYKVDGTFDCYKGRLMAKGYIQQVRIAFLNTFSLVAKLTIMRVLLALAAQWKWKLVKLGVSNAFLVICLRKFICNYLRGRTRCAKSIKISIDCAKLQDNGSISFP
ncbi:hypothetical protein CR513_22346, partial [Mucuna pruriens]